MLQIAGRVNLVVLLLGAAVNGMLAYKGVTRGYAKAVVGVFIILPFLAGLVIVPSYIRAQEGLVNACAYALSRGGVIPALDLYATDNAQQFPDSLGKLTPKYLKSIPKCMGAQYNGTRWPWSVAGPDGEYGYISTPDHRGYTVFCQGLWHRGGGVSTPNYPQYGSEDGLVRHPP